MGLGKFATRSQIHDQLIYKFLLRVTPLENGLVSFRKASSLRETRHVTISLGGVGGW